MKPGKYVNKAFGLRSFIKVETELSTDKIVDIKVVSHNEVHGQAYGMEYTAFENYIPAIIKYQSLSVPFIAGAEVVCAAVRAAVKKSIIQAGGDPEDFKRPLPQPEKEEDLTIETDLLVCGSGIAGLSAAVESLHCDAKVVLIEKQGIIGGSSLICGGKIIAAGSDEEKAQGILDTPEMLFNFLKGAGGSFLNDSKVNYFCYKSNENLCWLKDHGYVVDNLEAPHSSILPWRVHNSLGGQGQTMGWGCGFILPLYHSFLEMGGKAYLNTALKDLIVEDGRVVGAVAEDTITGRKITIRTKLGVFLGTGGYAANRQLVESRYPWMKDYFTNCPLANVGDGAAAAEKIGAYNYVHPFIQTMMLDEKYGIGVNEEAGLLVTTEGKRFCNEYQFHSVVGSEMAKAGSAGGWYITSGNEPYDLLKFVLTKDYPEKASSPEELADKIGVNKEVFLKTLEEYNKICHDGFDYQFGKPAAELFPVEGPEYYAIPMTPSTSITFGGLEIDIAGRVLDCDKKIIPGLFASGEVANTGNFGSAVPSCGYSIGHALHFGRVAARSACHRELI